MIFSLIGNTHLCPTGPTPPVSRIYQKQNSSKSSASRSQHQQQPKYQPRHPSTQLNPNPYISKPPASRSHMSTSQTDLKQQPKDQQSRSSSKTCGQNKLSNSTSSLSNGGSPPVISLNQKCSCCSQVLGQGSAMFIEKLGLAFHLKCFRCSVCSVPLGNGKEGTDVRVSVTNRLHCNNCFSNDLGKIYFNFNFIHCDFSKPLAMNANTTKKYDSVSENNFKSLNNPVTAKPTPASTRTTSTSTTPLHLNYENKPEVYYRMYKMPLNKKQIDINRQTKVSDDYLIIPNYINLKAPASTALNTATTKRHSGSYRNSFSEHI